jgi:predicted DNA-binding transcriptional regulator YafY
MSEIARLYRYRSLLSRSGAISAADLQAELEISASTFKRDIAKLRDQLHVPIVFDRDRGGYCLEGDSTGDELPGLWFSYDELLALLTIQQLLSQIEPTVLAATLRPLEARLSELMGHHGLEQHDIAGRILMLNAKKRILPPRAFEVLAAATVSRKRIAITHLNRQSGTRLQREVSPQRLVYYQENWYLDAWCHLRESLRSFSLDAIEDLAVMKEPALEVSQEEIDATMSVGYGIFSGAQTLWAKLKFSPLRSQWVSREIWHPQQRSTTESDGSFVLSIPYSDDRELVGEILRFGPDVEVLGPHELKAKVQKNLLAAISRYM